MTNLSSDHAFKQALIHPKTALDWNIAFNHPASIAHKALEAVLTQEFEQEISLMIYLEIYREMQETISLQKREQMVEEWFKNEAKKYEAQDIVVHPEIQLPIELNKLNLLQTKLETELSNVQDTIDKIDESIAQAKQKFEPVNHEAARIIQKVDRELEQGLVSALQHDPNCLADFDIHLDSAHPHDAAKKVQDFIRLAPPPSPPADILLVNPALRKQLALAVQQNSEKEVDAFVGRQGLLAHLLRVVPRARAIDEEDETRNISKLMRRAGHQLFGGMMNKALQECKDVYKGVVKETVALVAEVGEAVDQLKEMKANFVQKAHSLRDQLHLVKEHREELRQRPTPRH